MNPRFKKKSIHLCRYYFVLLFRLKICKFIRFYFLGSIKKDLCKQKMINIIKLQKNVYCVVSTVSVCLVKNKMEPVCKLYVRFHKQM